ncbi:serine hydrolase domain-containing protein [Aquimarina gracilis]|uniref:Serine hydrolase domain-containing protein n=1 Tax=Aquimarina gracilis TaxID=874422 RepID=A0ABU5ZVL7_9FLAO|nr:serine hydrolase domain-containing protein [Aquimarina gracilis]MEB3345871.1 serine hydrolase domain-containing protein [Aquimarina gracilis]
MKKYIIPLLLVVLLISCNSQNPTSDFRGTNTTINSFSKNYKPFQFENDQRVQLIEKVTLEIQKSIENHADSKKIPGFAYGIVVDDNLILAKAKGLINIDNQLPATIKSSFRIASMTKSFTAMAILKLRDEGKLRLDDPVANYIPEMANLEYLTSDSPKVTIENLLTMTAGFPEDNPWGDRQLEETDKMLIDLIKDGLSFSNVSSFRYEYSNTGYALLGKIISRITGISYQDYIQEHILLPLGMKNTYWEYTNIPENQFVLGYRWDEEDKQLKKEPILHDGSYAAMGGLITSIDDFSKYVSFHLSAWPARSDEDNGPIKRSTLREMHNPQYPFLVAKAKDYNNDPCAYTIGYGYGLGISKDCHRITKVKHSGALPGYASNYVFYPDYGVGIMAFGNLTYTSPLPTKEIEKLLFETAKIQPRILPVSDILKKRQKQIVELIQHWDQTLATDILAENFFLDASKENRESKTKDIFKKAGVIIKIHEIRPRNQLRGSFDIQTEKGIISVFFTLTPEKNPKVQRLDLKFESIE